MSGAKLQYNDALLADVTALSALESATASGSPATATVTTTIRVTSTAGPESAEAGEVGTVESAGGVSTAAAAGIGAGVGVPLLVAAAVLLFLLLRERKKRKAYQDQLAYYGITTKSPPSHDPTQAQYQPVTEHTGHYHVEQPKPVPPPSELTADPRYELQH
jgi:hypothetical protein